MKRYAYVDYAKAVCFVLVVFIHTGFSVLNNVILFAMPLFFAATGYTFAYGKRTPWQNIRLRFKTILIPFVLLMLFYTALEVARAYLFGYGDISIALPSLANTLYGSGIMPFEGGIFQELREIMSYKAQPPTGVDLILPSNCHLWFLPAMFSAYSLFVLAVGPLRRRHGAKVVVVGGLLLVATAEAVWTPLLQLPLGLGRGALGAAFMLVGFWIKAYGLLEGRSKAYYAVTNLAALGLFVPALLLGSGGGALVRSVYGPHGAWSVLITFVGGVAGVWLLLSLCKAAERLPLERLKGTLSYIGQNGMTVYAWHMAVKFLLDAVYICLIKSSDFSLLDEFKMGLMPQTSLWFMLFEAVAVLAVCLWLCHLKDRLRRRTKA